jgi:hypothetical protein
MDIEEGTNAMASPVAEIQTTPEKGHLQSIHRTTQSRLHALPQRHSGERIKRMASRSFGELCLRSVENKKTQDS